jgi:formate dehydrogenase major subunit
MSGKRMQGNGSSWLNRWPVLRQVRSGDVLGLGATAASERSPSLEPRTKHADRVVKSVCPYCAVGCGQNVYVKDEKIIDIEGDADSPISGGRLCPKGSASFQLVTGNQRRTDVLYRRPFATGWEKIPLDRAMDMVADRMKKARDENWQESHEEGYPLHRTLAMAHLGGATLDNEENYLIKKLFTALGIVQIENQARI